MARDTSAVGRPDDARTSDRIRIVLVGAVLVCAALQIAVAKDRNEGLVVFGGVALLGALAWLGGDHGAPALGLWVALTGFTMSLTATVVILLLGAVGSATMAWPSVAGVGIAAAGIWRGARRGGASPGTASIRTVVKLVAATGLGLLLCVLLGAVGCALSPCGH